MDKGVKKKKAQRQPSPFGRHRRRGGGARLTLSEGVGLRADLRLRRLRALLPQATRQVRPQGGFGATRLPCRPSPRRPCFGRHGCRGGGARLTLSDGAGLRADLRLRRLRALLPQATLQVRPQGASGANAPPASLLPLSLGGCTVVHPYKRLITIEISTFVVMLSRFLLGLLPRSSRHGDVHPARSAQSRVAAHPVW